MSKFWHSPEVIVASAIEEYWSGGNYHQINDILRGMWNVSVWAHNFELTSYIALLQDMNVELNYPV